MAGIKLGLDCKAYRNSGTYASPTWNLVAAIKDVTLSMESAEADVSTRDNNGFRNTVQTLTDASVDFVLISDRTVTDDKADVDAIRTAFLAKDAIEMIFLDDDVTSAATGVAAEGLRASWVFTKFSRVENLEEGVTYEVTAKATTTISAGAKYPPAWYTGATPA